MAEGESTTVDQKGASPGSYGLQPPHSPRKSVGFSNGDGRPITADRRTVTSMDGPPLQPVQPVQSERRRKVFLAPTSTKDLDLDDYFSGPLDPTKHSRLPMFMRVHGSILPKLLVPLLFVGAWSTAITCISQFVFPLEVNSLLLTVLGFVVALALSFRSSSGYERYGEGRKLWAQLILNARNLAHNIWIYGRERPGQEKEDLLSKLTAINLLAAFANAVKHKLRHEPEYDYTDLKPLINHLDTFAKKASAMDRSPSSHNRELAQDVSWGEYLGIAPFTSNPQRAYKEAAKAGKHHGNLPYEIINFLGAWANRAMVEEPKMFDNTILQGQFYIAMNAMSDAYVGCERIVQTPLPLAYNIAISQITWLYVLMLPFQLFKPLGWITIPGTLVAAYIILGIAAIGQEVENPFGTDCNDLDLDKYCAQLQYDLNVLTSKPAQPYSVDWVECDFNLPLYPYSFSGYNAWKSRSMEDIREALANKVIHQATAVAEHGGMCKNTSARVDEKKILGENGV